METEIGFQTKGKRVNKYFIQNELQLVAIAQEGSSQFYSLSVHLQNVEEPDFFYLPPAVLKGDDDLDCCHLETLPHLLLSYCNDLDPPRIHDLDLQMEHLGKGAELLCWVVLSRELADIADLVFAEYFEAEQHVDDEIQHDHVRAGPGGLRLPTSQHTGLFFLVC